MRASDFANGTLDGRSGGSWRRKEEGDGDAFRDVAASQ